MVLQMQMHWLSRKNFLDFDEVMNRADSVAIMQSIANPDKYQLSDQGKFNSDLNGDGITNNDTLDIQKKLLGLEQSHFLSYAYNDIYFSILQYQKEPEFNSGSLAYIKLSFQKS